MLASSPPSVPSFPEWIEEHRPAGRITGWFHSVPWLLLARTVCVSDCGSRRRLCNWEAFHGAAEYCRRDTSRILLQALKKEARGQLGLACSRKHTVWEPWPGARSADAGPGLYSTELMLLELEGREARKAAGAVCMEKSGCSPFPMCWAKGIKNGQICSVSVLLQFMLLY